MMLGGLIVIAFIVGLIFYQSNKINVRVPAMSEFVLQAENMIDPGPVFIEHDDK